MKESHLKHWKDLGLRIIRTFVTKSAQKTRGSLQPLQYIVDAWADFGVFQSKRCGCSHDQTTGAPERECAALYIGGMILLPVKPETRAHSYDEAGQCMLPKLRSKNAQGTSLEKFHRRTFTIGG